jgi:hypothetical protein
VGQAVAGNLEARNFVVDGPERLLVVGDRRRGFDTIVSAAASHHMRCARSEMFDCQDGYMTFWQTKNGRVRRIPITDTIAAVLASRPRIHAWVFTNAKTGKPYTTIRKVFERALER